MQSIIYLRHGYVNIKRYENKANTDLYFLLKSLPSDILFFHEYDDLRHPLGIYNLSSTRVIDAFRDVLNGLSSKNDYDFEIFKLNTVLVEAKKDLKLSPEKADNINTKIQEYESQLQQLHEAENKENKRILDAQKELLDSLMAFSDDSEHILKCFFSVHSIRPKGSSYKHLLKEYKGRIEDYRNVIAHIDNKIKHNHARLSSIKFKTELGNIEGYYVVGITQGSIGTNREIHKPFRNQDTAFSFNRDLKFHLINFIFICHYLKVIIGKIDDKYSITLESNTAGFDDIYDIVERIQVLPNLFFPDEFFKQVPEIKIADNETEFILPSSDAKLLTYLNSEIRCSFIGDGVSNRFRLPYGARES
jgi:hypothetical protein